MQEKRYLLDIRQMLEGDHRETLLQEAFDRIDGERRRKALPIKNIRAQAAGVGAGLLIQKVLSDHMSGGGAELPGNQTITRQEGNLNDSSARREGNLGDSPARQEGNLGDSPARQIGMREKPVWQRLSVEELLVTFEQPVIEPCYRYGEHGKPYLEGLPIYFNLSHSGSYVFCGVSTREIGVDIQKIQKNNELRLAKRFFSSVEYEVLENCINEQERRRIFFRMWTRKEAYGKLTGQGLGGVMEKNLWRDGLVRKTIWADGSEKSGSGTGEYRGVVFEEDGLRWEEYDVPPDYQIAVCTYAI